jgi:hypothetical protein
MVAQFKKKIQKNLAAHMKDEERYEGIRLFFKNIFQILRIQIQIVQSLLVQQKSTKLGL